MAGRGPWRGQVRILVRGGELDPRLLLLLLGTFRDTGPPSQPGLNQNLEVAGLENNAS